MRIENRQWVEGQGWTLPLSAPVGFDAQLVFVFGSPEQFSRKGLIEEIRSFYPNAHMVGCSTAGNISCGKVYDNSIVTTAVKFERTEVALAQVRLSEVKSGSEAGVALASSFDQAGLRHLLVFSDGLRVNGSDLVKGLWGTLPYGVAVTGGLAGDGLNFGRTLVCLDGPPEEGKIAAVGFYGDRLRVGYGSVAGWEPFGVERVVTRSKGARLISIDGEPALSLYRKYLGDLSSRLPASACMFPLSVKVEKEGTSAILTPVSVDERTKSVIMSGDVPEGSTARLMRAGLDWLVSAAMQAANLGMEAVEPETPQLALIMSGVGRKMVMGQRAEEEVECVRDVFGPHTSLAGFYSYGEIAPTQPHARYELRNQTMTITTFLER